NILINSIDAFRKYDHFRPVMKVAASIAAAALGILASAQIAQSDQIFTIPNAGLAIGTASVAYASTQLFSDKMKYFTSEGWRGRVVDRQQTPSELLSDSQMR